MQDKGIPMKKGITRASLNKATPEKAPLYVFNATGGRGFVIVSGDERTEEILGYGMDCQFDEARIPETMKGWLDIYTSEISALQNGVTNTRPLRVPLHSAVAHLVTTSWGQGDSNSTGSAYNQQCPKLNGTYCVTGCVATAMAQIMRFHKWPQNYTSAIPSYTSNDNVGYLSSLSRVKLDWANMLERYNEGQTTAQCKAVAQLMRYCGQSVKMDYDPDASSAYTSDVAMALRTYFDYDINTRYEKRSDYSAESWDNLIYNELKNGRPVLYSGSNPGGGHAFVCDGYDGQGYYHINWGWEGYCNGYFKLMVLNPGGGGTGSGDANSGYSMAQGAIVGIQKATSETYERRTLSLEDFWVDGHTINAKYGNRTSMSGTFVYGLAYQKADDTSSTYKLKKTTDLFEPLDARTYSSNMDTWNFEDGSYRIYPYAILDGSKWYHVIGDRKKYYEVKFKNGKVTETSYHPRSNLNINSVEFTGNKIAGQPQEVRITVSNSTEEYNDLFYLFASKANDKGEYVDKTYMAIESGGEETTSLYFTPTSSGKWKVWLDIVEDGSNDLSPWEVTIKSAPTAKTNLSVVSHEISTTTEPYLKFKVKNNGTAGYYMPINCYIFEDPKDYSITYDKTDYLNLGPGETVNLTFHFESLEIGKAYHAYLRCYTDHQSGNMDWFGYRYDFVVNTTDIDEVNTDTFEVADVYTLSGLLVRKQATTLEGLPKGIYIVDGKKKVVK